MRRIATQLALHLTSAARTDGELLAGFLNAGADSDFAELVRRHGPLVWGVCRRALPDPADAEDAFQAVFLVLVRRASGLTDSPTVGPWLHRVAAWTARNVRRRNARRLAKRVPLSDHLPATTTNPDLPLDLDAALLTLPDKYRSPVVLCHLLGFSRADAARQLGCPEGTLSAWLSRGLAKLRARLGGLDPAKALGLAAVAVPGALSSSVVRATVASRVAATTAVAASSTVSQVVEGVIHMFWVKKATAASAALFAIFALGVGVGVSGRQGVGVAEARVKTGYTPSAKQPAPPTIDEEIAKLEAELRAAEDGLAAAREGVKLTAAKIALYKDKGGVTEVERLNDLITQTRFKENEAQATTRVLELKKRIADLKGAKLRADQDKPPAKNPPAELADLDKQIVELQVELYLLRLERKGNAAKAAEIEAKTKDLQARTEDLVHKRRLLAKVTRVFPAVEDTGYIELTLHGKGRQFEFTIKETDASGKAIGTASVREPDLLQKLLIRAYNDPAAPKQLRVATDPNVALNGYVVVLFKACEAAGFKTVKFTGYMPKNNFLQELKSDQKGEVEGFKRYDAAERDTASLIKEMENWLRSF